MTAPPAVAEPTAGTSDQAAKIGIPAIRIPAAPLAAPATPPPAPTSSAPIHVSIPSQPATASASPPPPAPAAKPAPPPANLGPKITVMPVPETTKALSVKPPGEAQVHEAPPASASPTSSAEPRAAGSPKMAYMPVPESTKALSVKPPGEATTHEPPPASAPSAASAEPKAAGSPKMAYMPVPDSAKSLSVKPPGEAQIHEAPPSAPVNASGDPKAPGSPKMAFMPAPAAGSGSALSVSGGHGKKEEKPADATPVAATTSPPPIHAHPAAAKMASAPPPRPGGTRLGMGITGAVIGCLLGAAIWYFIAVNVVGLRILAWIPGILGGLGAIILARKPSEKLGKAAAIVAAIITILAQISVISGINDKRLTEASEAHYKTRMALARKAADAKTDADIRKLIEEDPDYGGFESTSLREAVGELGRKLEKMAKEEEAKAAGKDPGDADELAQYRQKRLPELIKFSKGDPTRTRFLEKERARLEEDGEILYRKKPISMGIWIFSSIEAAFLLGRGKKKE